jgi:phosphoribosylaminoimidazolecarboxamide formyltransferase/IMP cyclohydrolase
MRAILSVADKEGLEAFAHGLSAMDVELVSTGGTADVVRQAGLPVRTVAEVTGFPEILGGRVKTLHPAVHGAILARRDDEGHMAELRERQITPIDIVVCNLYPFADVLARGETDISRLLEEIDVGGVTLLRAAAKNYPHVTVVVRPQDYSLVLDELQVAGTTRLETRRRLAAIAFQHTALYDTLIAEYLRKGTAEELFADELTLGVRRLRTLRYGENPHQQSALYVWSGMAPSLSQAAGHVGNGASVKSAASAAPPSVAGAKVLHGKELSFNNLLDLDAALNCVSSFTAPAAVVIKHTNPCGLACDDSLAESYRQAHAGDPVSAYGGILGFNREVDAETATEVAQIFYNAIIAPGYTPEALAVLQRKRDLLLLATGTPIGPATLASGALDPRRLDVRSISGGLLIQTADRFSEQDIQRQVVTEREPTLEEVTDLLFAWKAVQHVKSNGIVLAKKLRVVGVGAGQMSRVYSVQIAVDRAGDRVRPSVMASDAYFPFPDGVETAAKAGVSAIIQPGGSIRDNEAIRMANRYGVAMILTGQRHFRH